MNKYKRKYNQMINILDSAHTKFVILTTLSHLCILNILKFILIIYNEQKYFH